MIYEFKNPIPVNTELGEGWIMYVRDGGTWSNDIFAVVLEKDGALRHFRSDQFVVFKNNTFGIKNPKNLKDL
jgi:hypothetical protein